MQEMAGELVASEPDVVVFLTPHGNVFSDCLTVLREPQLCGDLAKFGRPEVKTVHPNQLELVRELSGMARQKGISLVEIDRDLARRHGLNEKLDHGVLVPLNYLEKAGMGNKPVVSISVGYLDVLELYAFGQLIRQAAQRLQMKAAVVASGDMSHRLKDEGPYDYHPDGSVFDQQIKELLRVGDIEAILRIPDSLRHNAGECGYMSIVIMLGALDGYAFESRIFSYEGPFGVGYLVAGLAPGSSRPSVMERLKEQRRQEVEARRANESPPVRWARRNLECRIRHETMPEVPSELERFLQERAGAFVSIKKNGRLRGCIGTFLPTYSNLAEEIANNALAAGLNDPRFNPVEPEELDSLVYSVDILSAPEPASREELDPKRYGVIVSCGRKRGLLLPDLEGVDTVEQQLQIALEKAGITPREKYSIEKFAVKRYV